ncbi:MAG: hypothetical protein HQL76_13250 [Magnetococcales bacterium]|nr:hypothetical protein [Magnetococcales bacterium]
MDFVRHQSTKQNTAAIQMANVLTTTLDPEVSAERNAECQRRVTHDVSRQHQEVHQKATEDTRLSCGISFAFDAAIQLRKAMDQIAARAQEADSTIKRSMESMEKISINLARTAEKSLASRKKTEMLQNLIVTASTNIATMSANMEASDRQSESGEMIAEMEKHAANIGKIVQTVGHIADQSNLLVLNSAIEAASRACLHGRGFAVVADEVHSLAEAAEKNASSIQKLVKTTQEQARFVITEILMATKAAQGAVGKGGVVADATAECQKTIEAVKQQSLSLCQNKMAAQQLEKMAETMKYSADVSKSAEELASVAVEEINKAANQIIAAVEQINRSSDRREK